MAQSDTPAPVAADGQVLAPPRPDRADPDGRQDVRPAPALAAESDGSAPAHPGPPCVMVIFGATGDLTKRKLVPALYNLATSGLLSGQFAVVGSAARPGRRTSSAARMTDEMKRVRHPGHRPRALGGPRPAPLLSLRRSAGRGHLQRACATCSSEVDAEHGTDGNYFFYLATAPEFFAETVQPAGRGRADDRRRTAAGGA